MSNIHEEDVKDLFGFSAPSQEQLNNIGKWATKALELKAQIELVEEHLKQLNIELNEIEVIHLANALTEAGMEEFTLKDGATIKLKDVIRNGLSKDPVQRQLTFDWVTEVGGKDIIKDHFEIDYNKGSYDQALKLRRLLQEHHINFDEFESIHVQTLWAFLREKLDEVKRGIGELPPFDKMGLYYARHAEVKLPRVKK